MLIMVDVDSTIADLMPVWLELYNIDYGDFLDKEDITIWGIDQIVKPECGTKIYGYLRLDSLYDTVKPIEGALDGITSLRDANHRVVYASSGVHSSAKFLWLERNGFQPGRFAEDYIVVYDKGLIKGDLLIDDRDKNIELFGSSRSILFDQPWNRSFIWHNRAQSWKDVVEMVSRMNSL